MPGAWVISRMCEEFSALPCPGAVLAQPAGLMAEMLDLRAYAQAKRTIEQPVPDGMDQAPIPEWMARAVGEVMAVIVGREEEA